MKKVLICASLVLILVAGAFTLSAANKPSMAVAEFTNHTSAGWWYSGVGQELSGMLTNELASTEKFKMVERKNLNDVLDEQDLAASGRISKSSGAKIGKLTGAKYLVVATVSAYEENTAGGGGGISFRGISVGGKKDSAYIAVDLRVIDTTTGDVEYTRTVEARSESKGIRVGLYKGGLGGNLSKYENTPTGKAIRGVIIEITDYLACAMVDQDSCMDEYRAKEKSRRDKTKKSIKLD